MIISFELDKAKEVLALWIEISQLSWVLLTSRVNAYIQSLNPASPQSFNNYGIWGNFKGCGLLMDWIEFFLPLIFNCGISE